MKQLVLRSKQIVFLAVYIGTGLKSYALDQMMNSIMAGTNDSSFQFPANGMNVATGGKFTLKVHTSCFPTNLRGVANPIAPSSIIKTNLNMTIGGKPLSLYFEFPGLITTRSGMAKSKIKTMDSSRMNGSFNGAKATVVGAILGNTILAKLDVSTVLSRKADGSFSSFEKPPTIESYKASQEGMDCGKSEAVYGSFGYSSYTPTYNCGAFMAVPGEVTTKISNLIFSPDYTTAEISLAFPGQTGFCGGYWSPLMLFFDEKRPAFSGASEFPLNPYARTGWVEPGAPGYFLVYDKYGNKKVTDKDQLFGNAEKIANGFERLREFDSNKDGVISKSDKRFNKLFLWNDKNGDGVAQSSEVKALNSLIDRISLDYVKNEIIPVGKNAEFREHSKFFIKNKNGKERQGQIIDVWLAPQPAS